MRSIFRVGDRAAGTFPHPENFFEVFRPPHKGEVKNYCAGSRTLPRSASIVAAFFSQSSTTWSMSFSFSSL